MIRTSTQWWEIGLFSTSEPGLDRPDLMMHYGSVPFDMNTARWGYPTTENGFCLTPNVCRGRSRGTVRLRSRDYRDRARVDPRYFTDPEGHDEQVMLYGVGWRARSSRSRRWPSGPARELAPGPDAQTDDELIDYIHKTHNTVYHPACTAQMGPDSDPDGGRRPAPARARRAGPARGRRLDHAVPAGDQPVHHDDDDRREVRRHADPGRPRGASRRARLWRAADRAATAAEVADFLRHHPPFDALDDADVAARRRGRRGRATTRPAPRSSPRAPSRSGTCASCAAAPSSSSSTGACSTCSASASSSGRPRCSRACPPASRARAERHASATASRPTSPAGCSAGPRRCGSSSRSLLDRGRLAREADASRRDATPRTSPSPRSCAGRWSSARRDTAIRDAAQRMTDGGRHVRRRRPRRRIARDPHRSRPAHARGGRRPVRRRARLGGDDGAGLHGARPTGWAARCCWTCSTAASATSPSSRRPAGCSASSRTPTWSAAETRTPFHLRAAIARATTDGRARRARRASCARRSSRCTARGRRRCTSPRVHSVVVDALIRRLIELAVADVGAPPTPFAWLALGSLARREALPGLRRRQRDGVARRGRGRRDPRATRWRSAAASTRASRACGLRVDARGTTAANPLLVRSLASWRRAAQQLARGPDPGAGADPRLGRRRQPSGVGHPHRASRSPRRFRDARRHPALLRQLARFSLSFRPPTGFLRGLVVEHSGEHRGRLDLKHGGLVPIVDLARWAGMAAGRHQRLDARAPARGGRGGHAVGGGRRHAGATPSSSSWACASSTRSSRSRPGAEPDDHLDPATLSPLTRTLPQGGVPRGGVGAEGDLERTRLGVR